MDLESLPKKRIYYSLLFVVVLAIVTAIILWPFFGPQRLKENNNVTTDDVVSRGSFVAPGSSPDQAVLRGTINEIFNAPEDSRIRYILTDETGKNLAYLYSIEQDLSLSVGINAELQGRIDPQSYEGLKVLKVEKIKLK